MYLYENIADPYLWKLIVIRVSGSTVVCTLFMKWHIWDFMGGHSRCGHWYFHKGKPCSPSCLVTSSMADCHSPEYAADCSLPTEAESGRRLERISRLAKIKFWGLKKYEILRRNYSGDWDKAGEEVDYLPRNGMNVDRQAEQYHGVELKSNCYDCFFVLVDRGSNVPIVPILLTDEQFISNMENEKNI